MKRIKNIHIKDSLNIGEVDTMYETMDEVEKAFPNASRYDLSAAKDKLTNRDTIGLVLHECAKEDRPYFIHVVTTLDGGEPVDKFEILGYVQQLIDVPVTHEKVLKRRH